jgi:hypothetical protein
MDYPAKKEELVQQAREHGTPENVVAVLERLRGESRKSPAELMKSVGEIE